MRSRSGHNENRRFSSVLSSRKAQMEMVGLVVIVILITLGMLFLAMFALKEDPQKKVFTRKGLSYSGLSSILKTTVVDDTCTSVQAKPVSLGKDILEDCAQNAASQGGECGFGCQYSCQDLHSCDYFEQTVEAVLEESLGIWNKRYDFKSVLVQGSENIELVALESKLGNCERRERDSSGIFPLQLRGVGLVRSELRICD